MRGNLEATLKPQHEPPQVLPYWGRVAAPAGAGEGKTGVNALPALSFVPGDTRFLPALHVLPTLPIPSTGFCNISPADALLEENHVSTKLNGGCSSLVALETLLPPAHWRGKGAALCRQRKAFPTFFAMEKRLCLHPEPNTDLLQGQARESDLYFFFSAVPTENQP